MEEHKVMSNERTINKEGKSVQRKVKWGSGEETDQVYLVHTHLKAAKSHFPPHLSCAQRFSLTLTLLPTAASNIRHSCSAVSHQNSGTAPHN